MINSFFLARLMAQIPKEEAIQIETNGVSKERETVRGGAFDRASEVETPFGFGKGEGFDKGRDESEWVVSRERFKSDEQFDTLNPVDGKVNGKSEKSQI